MAETSRLLICRTGHTVPRVRIPPSPPFSGPPHFSRILTFLTVCLVVFVGCQTGIRFLYTHSDWFIERWANEFLDFRGERRKQLHQEVQSFFKEHQRIERPLIAYYLSATADLISRGDPTEAKIQSSLNDFENLAQRTFFLAVPGASRILSSLSVTEIDRLKRNIEQKNSHLQAEWQKLSLEDWQKRRQKGFIRAFQFLAGSPSQDQLALIEQWIAESSYSKRDFWFQYRKSQQEGLIQMLRKQASPSDIESFLENWIDHRKRSPNTEYAKYLQTERQRFLRIVFDLSLSLSPKQKKHFVNTLQDLVNSLNES